MRSERLTGKPRAIWLSFVLLCPAAPLAGQARVERFLPPLRAQPSAAALLGPTALTPFALHPAAIRQAAPVAGILPLSRDSSEAYPVILLGAAIGAGLGFLVADFDRSGGTSFLPATLTYAVPVALGAHLFNGRRGSLGADVSISVLTAPFVYFLAALGFYSGSAFVPAAAVLGHIALVAGVERRGGDSRAMPRR